MTDLREELARVLCQAQGCDPDAQSHPYRKNSPAWELHLPDADALLPIIARVRAEERERCAKVADLFSDEHQAASKDTLALGNTAGALMRARQSQTSSDIAAAIRALGDK